MRLYDNTKLSAFKRCPRYYMYRHVMHWRPKGTSVPLIYGGAWHAAMEVIWANIAGANDRVELARRAYNAFLTHWCAEGMPPPGEIDYEMEKELSPRTPGRAFEMIVSYIDKRSQSAADFELIAIEKPFIVPLDPQDDTLFYIGKIDKIVRRRGKVLGIEHKTTTAYRKGGPFRGGFVDSFSPNAQVDGYLYALHMLYPNQVGGVWVDASLVHKQEDGFTFIPIEKQLDHLDSWLYDTLWWVHRLEREAAAFKMHRITDKYLKAFPKNTNSCWDFASSCSYLYLCKAWPNPKAYGGTPPPGFEHDIWNPLDHIKGLEEMLDVDKDQGDGVRGGGGAKSERGGDQGSSTG